MLQQHALTACFDSVLPLTASCLCWQEWQDTLLAVGLWAEDTLLLQRLSGGDPICHLDCTDVGQPRSMVAVKMHSTDFLLVGTSQGWVVYHPITWGSPGEC